MIFLFLSIFVPIIVWSFFPFFIQKVSGKYIKRDAVLFSACLLYFISWYLPSPLIHGNDTSFTTHAIGGGLFSALLWLFAKRQLNWKASWFIEMLSLFAVVSMLGVSNELFELATVELHLTSLNGADTWWDLFANTLGAFLFWLIYNFIFRPYDNKKR